MEVDMDLFPAVRERVRIAREIDVKEYRLVHIKNILVIKAYCCIQVLKLPKQRTGFCLRININSLYYTKCLV